MSGPVLADVEAGGIGDARWLIEARYRGRVINSRGDCVSPPRHALLLLLISMDPIDGRPRCSPPPSRPSSSLRSLHVVLQPGFTDCDCEVRALVQQILGGGGGKVGKGVHFCGVPGL